MAHWRDTYTQSIFLAHAQQKQLGVVKKSRTAGRRSFMLRFIRAFVRKASYVFVALFNRFGVRVRKNDDESTKSLAAQNRVSFTPISLVSSWLRQYGMVLVGGSISFVLMGVGGMTVFARSLPSGIESIMISEGITYSPASEGGVLGVATVAYRKAPQSAFRTADVREYVFNEYFKTRNSPLQGQAYLFTQACDRYAAPKDCLTTVAIARHETDLCTYFDSADMKNCMGWGGAGPNRRQFSSFEEHINVATDVLVNQYGIQYMIDPRLMERVFCGPQAECDNWGNRILYFMEEIDQFAVSLGVGRLSALR